MNLFIGASCSEYTEDRDKDNELCGVHEKLDNVMGFEEFRLDEIEPLKFNFVNGQESLSLREVQMELPNDPGIVEGFDPSVRFESEAVMLDMEGRHQLTTVCVWCGSKFNHGAVHAETDSDSLGFIWLEAGSSGGSSEKYQVRKNQNIPGKPETKARRVTQAFFGHHIKERLKGTVNDVKNMKDLLIKDFDFPVDSIRIFTEEAGSELNTTRKNMLDSLNWLVEESQLGDSLLFYFSGHCLKQPDFNNDGLDGFDETICPVDFRTEGMIIDNDFNRKIVKPTLLLDRKSALADTVRCRNVKGSSSTNVC
ncbi:hypothetical protein RJ641_013291 [Dillenia turbinata]|uniref:Peptidase C14 caspase domain-containing protein n=1 Tax=Dillenia turbinata TaxID=194707 RepID=A0AAN8WGW1_9MAGN